MRLAIGKVRPQPDEHIIEREIVMARNISNALFVMVMIAIIVGVDVLIFRNRFWERLMVNIGIVLVFAAFYLRFLKNS